MKAGCTRMALLAALLPLAALADDFRLTGVIAASGGGKVFAVIEDARGEQRLLVEGDRIGEAQVVAIEAARRQVRLAFPDRVEVLTLDGSAFLEQPAYAIADYSGATVALELTTETRAALASLAAEAQSLGEAATAERLRRLLDLSSSAHIAAVNESPVNSSVDALQVLRAALESPAGSYLGTLAVDDAEGARRIYLMAN